jgi:hypothetical protein
VVLDPKQSRKRSVFKRSASGATRLDTTGPSGSWLFKPDALRKKRCACGSV